MLICALLAELYFVEDGPEPWNRSLPRGHALDVGSGGAGPGTGGLPAEAAGRVGQGCPAQVWGRQAFRRPGSSCFRSSRGVWTSDPGATARGQLRLLDNGDAAFEGRHRIEWRWPSGDRQRLRSGGEAAGTLSTLARSRRRDQTLFRRVRTRRGEMSDKYAQALTFLHRARATPCRSMQMFRTNLLYFKVFMHR